MQCAHIVGLLRAIEGAIGSEFKVDASYLSPHVNMAARCPVTSKHEADSGTMFFVLPLAQDLFI